jgi:hypothetical protein
LPQCHNLTPDARRRGHERGTKAADRAAGLMPLVRELRRDGKTLQGVRPMIDVAANRPQVWIYGGSAEFGLADGSSRHGVFAA